MQTIDKNSLKLKSFAIQDVQIDQNTIYVLDASNGVFRVALLENESVSVVERAETAAGYKKLNVYSTVLGNRRKIVLAAEGKILEFDWTKQAPELAYAYTVPAGAFISLAVNEEFVVAQIAE